MKALLYATISLFVLASLCSCAKSGHQQSAQNTPSKISSQCPVEGHWSNLLQRCISSIDYEVVLYRDEASSSKTPEIGIVFSDNRAQAELFSGEGASIKLEKNEQTLTYESADQIYRLVKSNGIWVCTETPNENIARAVSIYASR